MTDKPIIIDGVDVNECEYYNKYDKTCREVNGNYDTDICEFDKCENSNCVYKQLKAKEQECEALQMSENEAVEIIAELKDENDTLRQFLSKEPLALQALQSAYSSYKKSADVLYEMVKQYKQTLTEIKEIAKNSCCLQPTSTCEEYENCKECSRTSDDETVKQIIQKISEVENEYNTKDMRHINENK